MRKQNHETPKSLLRLCAAVCVCLLCAGLFCPAPGHAAEPASTPVMIRRPTRSPSPTPEPPKARPVFVQVYYVTENRSVAARAEVMLRESGEVKADPEMLPEGYEPAGVTACYVQVKDGAAEPAIVEFTVRRKAMPSPTPTPTSTPTPTANPSAVHQGTWGTCRWEIDRNGQLTIFAGEGKDTEGKCPWSDYALEIKTVRTRGKVVFPKDSSRLFSLCAEENDELKSVCTAIYFEEIDTSGVENMLGMFEFCKTVTSLDLSGFDTANVKNMNFMFASCESLASLDMSGFDTSNVTHMSFMFIKCWSFTSLDVCGLDTANVTDMNYMFSQCGGLTSMDLSGLDTTNVTEMVGMFDRCWNLTSLDVSGFDTEKVTDLSFMFNGCEKLKTLDVSKFHTSKATNMSAMFQGCSSLTTLDVSGFDAANATDLSFMFWGCGSLTSLDLRSFDTAKAEKMEAMFDSCSALKTVRLGAKFSFKGSHPTVQATLPDKPWRSASDRRTYSAREIAEKRSGIADTYTAE